MKNKLWYLILAIIIFIIIIIVAIVSFYKKEENNINKDISKVQESGEEYNSIHLNNFDFQIVNLTEEASNNIKNTYDFIYKMKEYLYKNGIVEANQAEYIAYNVEDDKMMIKFKLNDENQTRIIAKIDLTNELYEFVTY